MGKVSTNAIAHGFSGAFGNDLVFRRVGNKTFFMRKGKAPTRTTALQQQTRSKFSEASMYATTTLEDAQNQMLYALMASANGLRSAYVAAIKDFMTEPEIKSVAIRTNAEAKNCTVTITPCFVFKIVSLEITLLNADGSRRESGLARQTNQRWQYNTASPVEGCKLILKAHDRLGKVVVVEKGL